MVKSTTSVATKKRLKIIEKCCFLLKKVTEKIRSNKHLLKYMNTMDLISVHLKLHTP